MDERDDKTKINIPTDNLQESSTSNDQNTRACAACKYQRRRCASDCPLAPYFPPDNQKQFLNAHKLFGLRNMMRFYRRVKQSDRDMVMKSMIFEANYRANDPVGGCYRLIQGLQKQIQQCEAELGFVLNQLALFQNLSDSSLTAIVGGNDKESGDVKPYSSQLTEPIRIDRGFADIDRLMIRDKKPVITTQNLDYLKSKEEAQTKNTASHFEQIGEDTKYRRQFYEKLPNS